uniref:DUF4283 domain-containing protein n=1 Tax=Nelumbo nucifera TaxID=4432 RepID=A0A822YLR2_NELNU|nr:TPA_asm: hypothetical protein HUJ06_005744 [Nelumbo nucifera]
MQKGEADKQPDEYTFDYADLWVHLLGLPLAYLNVTAAKHIAAALGKPFEPAANEVEKWSKFVRIKGTCRLKHRVETAIQDCSHEEIFQKLEALSVANITKDIRPSLPAKLAHRHARSHVDQPVHRSPTSD